MGISYTAYNAFTDAQLLADVPNTNFYGQSDALISLQSAVRDLWALYCSADDDYLLNTIYFTSTQFIADQTRPYTFYYQLPSDFYRLRLFQYGGLITGNQYLPVQKETIENYGNSQNTPAYRMIGQLPAGNTFVSTSSYTAGNYVFQDAGINSMSPKTATISGSNHQPGSATTMGLGGFNPYYGGGIYKANISVPAYSLSTNAMPSSSTWSSIAYGQISTLAYYFVAVTSGASTTASYSTDGTTWTATSIPSGNWTSVAYGSAGNFIAISSGSTVAALSTNATTWAATAGALPYTAAWSSLAFGGSNFVAISSGGVGGHSVAAYTSNNGTAWTGSNLPQVALWSSIAYGNGTFCAVATGTNIAAISTTGATWTQTYLPLSENWDNIEFGNGIFIATASGSGSGAWSSDGVTWNLIKLPNTGTMTSVAFGNNTFFAVFAGSATAAVSQDGIIWTTRPLPSALNYTEVCFGNGLFVTVATGSSVTYAANVTDPPNPTYWTELANSPNGWLMVNDPSSYNNWALSYYPQPFGVQLNITNGTGTDLGSFFPDNLEPRLFAYQMAIDIRRKQKMDFTYLGERRSEMLKSLEMSLHRDDHKAEPLKNVFAVGFGPYY